MVYAIRSWYAISLFYYVSILCSFKETLLYPWPRTHVYKSSLLVHVRSREGAPFVHTPSPSWYIGLSSKSLQSFFKSCPFGSILTSLKFVQIELKNHTAHLYLLGLPVIHNERAVDGVIWVLSDKIVLFFLNLNNGVIRGI